MLTIVMVCITLALLVAFAANEYCIYREDEGIEEYKEKYYQQMEINKELLEELLKETE